MSKLDFQLNYYFQKLKDTSFVSRNEFRVMFRKKYGAFKGIEDLIRKIEEYQIKKYGCRIANYDVLKTSDERIRDSILSWKRRKSRLGK